MPEFFAQNNPPDDLCRRASGLAPLRPFFTPEYVHAAAAVGLEPWILALREADRFSTCCTAFLRRGRLNRTMEILSAPDAGEAPAFWNGLVDLCRREKVARLAINSFGSPSTSTPPLPGETSRRVRTEFVLDLRKTDPWADLGSNHKRNLKNGRKAGITIRRASDADACDAHVRLMAASLDRRSARGEDVDSHGDTAWLLAFIRAGAGQLFQALRGNEVLSSIFVLRAPRGAYYQSAGTSPDGMQCGASHFLVCETADLLRAEGIEEFNLGGASADASGLRRFKAEFGARPVNTEAVECFLAGPWKRRFTNAALRLRREPGKFLKSILFNKQEFFVYFRNTADVPPPTPLEGVLVRKLSDDDLRRIAREHPNLARHAERIDQFGFNGAYGLFCDGRLASIQWAITAEYDRRNHTRNIRLRDGEAELTHGDTLPDFRGRGYYTYMMQSLSQLLRADGCHRVFGMTSVHNEVAQRGIIKAGFIPCGRIVRFIFPLLPGQPSLAFRGHRWRRLPASTPPSTPV